MVWLSILLLVVVVVAGGMRLYRSGRLRFGPTVRTKKERQFRRNSTRERSQSSSLRNDPRSRARRKDVMVDGKNTSYPHRSDKNAVLLGPDGTHNAQPDLSSSFDDDAKTDRIVHDPDFRVNYGSSRSLLAMEDSDDELQSLPTVRFEDVASDHGSFDRESIEESVHTFSPESNTNTIAYDQAHDSVARGFFENQTEQYRDQHDDEHQNNNGTHFEQIRVTQFVRHRSATNTEYTHVEGDLSLGRIEEGNGSVRPNQGDETQDRTHDTLAQNGIFRREIDDVTIENEDTREIRDSGVEQDKEIDQADIKQNSDEEERSEQDTFEGDETKAQSVSEDAQHLSAREITDILWRNSQTVHKRPRRGFDPEADAVVTAARYRFRQRSVLLLVAATLIGFVSSLYLSGFFNVVSLVVPPLALAIYLYYLRRQVKIEKTIRERRLRRYINQQKFEAEKEELFRHRTAGLVVLEIDDEDPALEHLEEHPGFAARAKRNDTFMETEQAVGY